MTQICTFPSSWSKSFIKTIAVPPPVPQSGCPQLNRKEYSRAVVSVAAEEHGLPPVVPEPVLFRPLNVAALGIVRAHARLEILSGARDAKREENVE